MSSRYCEAWANTVSARSPSKLRIAGSAYVSFNIRTQYGQLSDVNITTNGRCRAWAAFHAASTVGCENRIAGADAVRVGAGDSTLHAVVPTNIVATATSGTTRPGKNLIRTKTPHPCLQAVRRGRPETGRLSRRTSQR